MLCVGCVNKQQQREMRSVPRGICQSVRCHGDGFTTWNHFTHCEICSRHNRICEYCGNSLPSNELTGFTALLAIVIGLVWLLLLAHDSLK